MQGVNAAEQWLQLLQPFFVGRHAYQSQCLQIRSNILAHFSEVSFSVWWPSLIYESNTQVTNIWSDAAENRSRFAYWNVRPVFWIRQIKSEFLGKKLDLICHWIYPRSRFRWKYSSHQTGCINRIFAMGIDVEFWNFLLELPYIVCIIFYWNHWHWLAPCICRQYFLNLNRFARGGHIAVCCIGIFVFRECYVCPRCSFLSVEYLDLINFTVVFEFLLNPTLCNILQEQNSGVLLRVMKTNIVLTLTSSLNWRNNFLTTKNSSRLYSAELSANSARSSFQMNGIFCTKSFQAYKQRTSHIFFCRDKCQLTTDSWWIFCSSLLICTIDIRWWWKKARRWNEFKINRFLLGDLWWDNYNN